MLNETNAYAEVIADLKKRRDDLNKTIKNLEELAGITSTSASDLAGPNFPESGASAALF